MADLKKNAKGSKFLSMPGVSRPDVSRPDAWKDITRVLRRFLDYWLCCITFGCIPVPRDDLHGEIYDTEPLDEEKSAIQKLVLYLDSNDAKEPCIDEERLRALSILTYSDNVELQRPAALFYAQISSKIRLPISELALGPLVMLLKSRDTQVLKKAALAISNFALSGPVENNMTILKSEAVKPLIQLLSSGDLEVQCHTCSCITTLATDDKCKQEIVTCGGLEPLLALAKSHDLKVQRNATGALSNLTNLLTNHSDVMICGAIPVLVDALLCKDASVQYNCASALTNLAVDERHRFMIVAFGSNAVTKRLIELLQSKNEKVKCQACLALRSLATDRLNQVMIVKLECLPALRSVIQQSRPGTVSAALACLRNLSMHSRNELSIIEGEFLCELSRIVHDMSNPNAQAHAAGTLRNLAAGNQMQKMAQSGCIEALLDMVVCPDSSKQVLIEVTATLALLADDDDSRECMLQYKDGAAFSHMIKRACDNPNADISYNLAGTIAQLSLGDISEDILKPNCAALLLYFDKFLSSADPQRVHIAIWTVRELQLRKAEVFRQAFESHKLHKSIQRVLVKGQTPTIKELAQAVLNKTPFS